MSRIGSNPIPIPDKVEINFKSSGAKTQVDVKGPKGELSQDIPEFITLKEEESILYVGVKPVEGGNTKALHGLSRSLIKNMVVGVTEGYQKELEIIGVGYRAEARGADKLVLLLGFSHPVEVVAPAGVNFEVPEVNRILVSGIDKQAVGQTAAEIRALKKPEPYKGKGIRYKGEYVIRKSAK